MVVNKKLIIYSLGFFVLTTILCSCVNAVVITTFDTTFDVGNNWANDNRINDDNAGTFANTNAKSVDYWIGVEYNDVDDGWISNRIVFSVEYNEIGAFPPRTWDVYDCDIEVYEQDTYYRVVDDGSFTKATTFYYDLDRYYHITKIRIRADAGANNYNLRCYRLEIGNPDYDEWESNYSISGTEYYNYSGTIQTANCTVNWSYDWGNHSLDIEGFNMISPISYAVGHWELVSTFNNSWENKNSGDIRFINATNNYSWSEAVSNGVILDFTYTWNLTEDNWGYIVTNYFFGNKGNWIYIYHNDNSNYSLWTNSTQTISSSVNYEDEYFGCGFLMGFTLLIGIVNRRKKIWK